MFKRIRNMFDTTGHASSPARLMTLDEAFTHFQDYQQDRLHYFGGDHSAGSQCDTCSSRGAYLDPYEADEDWFVARDVLEREAPDVVAAADAVYVAARRAHEDERERRVEQTAGSMSADQARNILEQGTADQLTLHAAARRVLDDAAAAGHSTDVDGPQDTARQDHEAHHRDSESDQTQRADPNSADIYDVDQAIERRRQAEEERYAKHPEERALDEAWRDYQAGREPRDEQARQLYSEWSGLDADNHAAAVEERLTPEHEYELYDGPLGYQAWLEQRHADDDQDCEGDSDCEGDTDCDC
jgi:hypothetical protein